MKITILDGNALNPGDLSWGKISKFGELNVFPRTPSEKVIERIADSDAVLLNKVQITEEILSHCPNLKYIGVQATGYNVIDLDACRRHNVTVTNVPSYSTTAVAQLVFSFISEFAFHVQTHTDSVKNGDWINCPDFCYWKIPPFELDGKTLGIFGYGNIGKRVSAIAKAYGMNVKVYTKSKHPEPENYVSLEELFSTSDFITLHAPMNSETDKIVNEKTLSLMKKSAYLINTARGGLVNENDLASFLKENKIAGYACDVLTQEPMNKDCPLLNAPNTLFTPHIAWAGTETRQRLLDVVADNLESFINGCPKNVVS